MSETLVAAYATAVGFVAAGIIGSFYQLVTAQPAGFRVTDSGIAQGVLSVVLCMFAGPYILIRNAIHAQQGEKGSFAWFAGALGIAAAWSLCSGIVLLQVLLALRQSLA